MIIMRIEKCRSKAGAKQVHIEAQKRVADTEGNGIMFAIYLCDLCNVFVDKPFTTISPFFKRHYAASNKT